MSNNITGHNAAATGRIMMGGATTTNMGIGNGGTGAVDASSYPQFWNSAKIVNRVACFEVQEADNGYILRYGHKEGALMKYKVAKDVEEVRDLITSIIVENKLGI